MFLNNLLTNKNKLNKCIFVTCGNWDLKKALPLYCKYLNIRVPSYFENWCNIKDIFYQFYGTKGGGMANMLKILGLELEGKHHSGLDDCYNIAKIAKRICEEGGSFHTTSMN
jgi:inhibitor of KinA sporulation pathway (predicted exonuclease)